jgi:hypothetical protein
MAYENKPSILKLTPEQLAEVKGFIVQRMQELQHGGTGLTALVRNMLEDETIGGYFTLRKKEQERARSRDAGVPVENRIKNYIITLRDQPVIKTGTRAWYDYDDAILKRLGFNGGVLKLLQDIKEGTLQVEAMEVPVSVRHYSTKTIGTAILFLMEYAKPEAMSLQALASAADRPVSSIIPFLQGNFLISNFDNQDTIDSIALVFGIKHEDFKTVIAQMVSKAQELTKQHGVSVGNLLDPGPRAGQSVLQRP